MLAIAGIIISGCVYLYFYRTKEKYMYMDNIEYIINEIKSAEPLPEKFYTCYEIMYPNSIHTKSSFKINKPSIQVVRYHYINVVREYKNPLERTFTRYFFFREIQKSTTPKECLNYILEEFDYLYNCYGVRKASEFYMNKNIDDLNEDEIYVLLKMYKNPSLYNPLKEKSVEDSN